MKYYKKNTECRVWSHALDNWMSSMCVDMLRDRDALLCHIVNIWTVFLPHYLYSSINTNSLCAIQYGLITDSIHLT